MPRFRVTAFKPTQDDWYSTYQLAGWYKGERDVRLVAVTCVDIPEGPYQVNVWGADDYGVRRDFPGLEAAYEFFKFVIQQEYVNRQWLKNQGFVQA